MAKGIACENCCYLDKTEKVQTGVMYKYGCRSNLAYRGHIVGWLSSDSGLKQMGCSDWCKLPVGTKFIIKSRFDDTKKESWLYCGKVNGRYLIYRIDTKLFVYKLVNKDFFRGQAGNIKSTLEIIKQNEIQFEASRRIAKKRRRKYNEKNGKNII